MFGYNSVITDVWIRVMVDVGCWMVDGWWNVGWRMLDDSGARRVSHHFQNVHHRCVSY